MDMQQVKSWHGHLARIRRSGIVLFLVSHSHPSGSVLLLLLLIFLLSVLSGVRTAEEKARAGARRIRKTEEKENEKE
ncbi:hypothetical protein OPIT5_04515 [Opitutaceae bacterium TAV5]|nr:hypothetical protein OPIT5_04515 [Opitutaceae bacterium TAV5]